MNRGYGSAYLLSGFLKCGICDANMIIVSGCGKGARYGCPQHWNRRACSNGLTIRPYELERVLLDQIQQAVLTPEVVDYLAEQVNKAQTQRHSKSESETEVRDVSRKIDRIVAAIETVGHSDALMKELVHLEDHKRQVATRTDDRHQLNDQQIRQHIAGALQDVSALLVKSPQLAKSKLSEHVDSIRLLRSRTVLTSLKGNGTCSETKVL